MKIENRDVASEYVQMVTGGRQFQFPLSRVNEVGSMLGMELKESDIEHACNYDQKFLLSSITIEPGKKDRLFTFPHEVYMLNDHAQNSLNLISERVIVSWEDTDNVRDLTGFLRDIKTGVVQYDHYKRGRYGAVGFNPRVGEVEQKDVCVKYYNLAYPYSESAWKNFIKNKKNNPTYELNDFWALSSVSGIGQYLAHRYMRAAGIPAPDVYIATSDILVQEYINGYTISELFDNYEVLLEKGKIDKDTFHDIAGWFEEVKPDLERRIRNVIDAQEGKYWFPNFSSYDVNWENIIITPEGLKNPEGNFYVIDPLR